MTKQIMVEKVSESQYRVHYDHFYYRVTDDEDEFYDMIGSFWAYYSAGITAKFFGIGIIDVSVNIALSKDYDKIIKAVVDQICDFIRERGSD